MKNKIAVTLGVILAFTVLLTACLTEIPDEKVTVTFNVAGGTPEVSDRVLTRGSKLGELVIPTKGADEFLGWFEAFVRYTEDTVINVDIDLIAKWKSPSDASDYVQVIFYTPETLPVRTVVDVGIGKAMGPIFPVDPRREGFWFEGWEWEDEEGDMIPFTKESVVTEDITVTAKWSEKTTWNVTMIIPATHRPANPDFTSGTVFQVYDGDCIDEWEQRFPPDLIPFIDVSNTDRYSVFFRWSEGGTATGIIYGARTPIEKTLTLTAYFGNYFYPKTFEVDLSTRGVTNNAGSGTTTRTAAANQVYNAANRTLTANFNASNACVWFQTPTALRPLLNNMSTENETQFRWEIEYEFADPTRDNDGNHFNFMIANIRGNDNWNATAVVDQGLQTINFGEIDDGTGERPGIGLIHNTAGTHSSTNGGASNREWIVIRGARGPDWENGAFTLTFKSIKIHLVQ